MTPQCARALPALRPQVRKRKWDNYSSGEELFGLPVTRFPELEATEREVSMLDRLYRCVARARCALSGAHACGQVVRALKRGVSGICQGCFPALHPCARAHARPSSTHQNTMHARPMQRRPVSCAAAACT